MKTSRRKRQPRQPNEEVARLRAEVARLRAKVRALKAEQSRRVEAEEMPALPPPKANGNLPAEETLDAIVARQIVRRRQAAGWSRAELAAKAGVRPATVTRVESGTHTPSVSTVDKLDRALRRAGA